MLLGMAYYVITYLKYESVTLDALYVVWQEIKWAIF